VIFEPGELPRREWNALLNGVVAPRPIAWVSTLAPDGAPNLAPFSFFNLFSYDPATIAVAPGRRRGEVKDTARNVEASGELVVNMVNRALAEHANASSGEFGPEVDEWEVAGVTPAASTAVAPPRVAESPASLECRVFQTLELGEDGQPGNTLIVARVLAVHVLDGGFLDGRVDPEALDLVGRMGSEWYSLTRERFPLPRPASAEPEAVRAELAERLR
jgi:flavin reductase (DIM6/NTAB) family NADH-FMN oxidoreductase RutF